jgi:hypothetical protein
MKHMKQDTKNFLESLLFVADNPDEETREFQDSTIYDFSPEFVAGVDSFIDGFREYLSNQESELAARADDCERSFGGNVFFTLSGHGCGFWDDRDMELGDYLADELRVYSGNRHRFEQLQHELFTDENGKIDLAILPQFIKERRAALFSVTPQQ